MSSPRPYYEDEQVTLYLGDCREVLPALDIRPDSCVTDPPYGEIAAEWDRWPDGWVKTVGAVLPASASLWSFGSARMFLDHVDEFAGWRFAQEALWLKRNGSGPTGRDRLVKVHEWAYHWYRGRWSDLHHEWERTSRTGPAKGTAHKSDSAVAHQGARRASTWHDDGTRQPRSVVVLEAPSVRFVKRHKTEKPLTVVVPVVRECTPPGGLVLDPFAGSGTSLVAARRLGRRAVGIESDPAACAAAAARLREAEVITK